MSSRFKVQQVSENAGNAPTIPAVNSQNELATSTDGDDSSPTETKCFMPKEESKPLQKKEAGASPEETQQFLADQPTEGAVIEKKDQDAFLAEDAPLTQEPDIPIEPVIPVSHSVPCIDHQSKSPPAAEPLTSPQIVISSLPTEQVSTAHSEQDDKGIEMKDASPEKEPLQTNVEKMETSKPDKGRFHVEFVDAKDEEEIDDGLSPPLSPSHDSTHNSHNTYSKSYYLRTFGHNTQEAVPMVAYYRNSSSVSGKTRPTLDELHDAKDTIESPTHGGPNNPELPTDPELGQAGTSGPIKFGWIKGVLVRCMLNIWGVMLFLRLSWVVGQAGIGLSVAIILLSAVVTVITTLSMSAICTNGQVRGGGAYYLISRSLGPEFGGAIGLIFSLANAVAVAMYVVGFAETVVDLMEENGASMTQSIPNDIRIIGCITVLLLLGITQLGMAWEAKAQIVLLIILLVSILNFIVGTFIPATQEKESLGFFNYKGTIAAENFPPDFKDQETFFSVFSIFFPAATGILAGCNISGDLKDAQKAIPKGTLLAILITSIVYCVIAVMLGCVELRGASGNISDFVGVNVTESMNCTTAACQLGWNYEILTEGCEGTEETCYKAGLLYDMQTMKNISGWGPIITAGIFAATLSSALASLVSAPKIFQAVCKDKVFPGIGFFAKGAPGTDEPRRGYLLAFIIALGFILIGELNAIAPIISNFFLASYTLINYSCFAASLSKSPGWRPAFKFYNMWLSLLGAFICCGVMFVINWWAALITIVIVLALYKFVDYKKPDVNWGSSTQAHLYVQALNSALKLSSVEDHVKNFRPQTLVLSGPPSHRPALVHFASQITKNVALMTCANVVQPQSKHPFRYFMKQRTASERWLKEKKIKSFYSSVVSPSLKGGVSTLMQSFGLGKMRTNTVLMGFKRDWIEADSDSLLDYIDIIHDAFDLNYGICILRLKEGLDISQYLTDDLPTPENDLQMPSSVSLNAIPSMSDFSSSTNSPAEEEFGALPADGGSPEKEIAEQETPVKAPVQQMHSNALHRDSSQLLRTKKGDKSSDLIQKKLKNFNQFQGKQEKGKTIDVWWLFDDGGLTILLPYLLSIKQHWSGCHLRVFTGGKQSRIDQEKRTMAQLLNKFRIEFKDVIVIGDIGVKPKKQSLKEYEDMIKPLRMFDADMTEEQRKKAKEETPWKITDDELEVLKEKTNRQIRLRELLQQHSMNAALVVMTLPMARKGTCSASLYMSWMEELTKDMPPMLLMRGNQTSVLTFYS